MYVHYLYVTFEVVIIKVDFFNDVSSYDWLIMCIDRVLFISGSVNDAYELSLPELVVTELG